MESTKFASKAQQEFLYAPAEPSANLQKVSQAEAARKFNVSPRSVASATYVLNHAIPELIEKVELGAVSVFAAAAVATLPEPEQREIVARGKKEIIATANKLRAEKKAARQASRPLKAAVDAVVSEEPEHDGKAEVNELDPLFDELFGDLLGNGIGAVRREAKVAASEASAQLAESLLLHYEESEFPALLTLIALAELEEVADAIRQALAAFAPPKEKHSGRAGGRR